MLNNFVNTIHTNIRTHFINIGKIYQTCNNVEGRLVCEQVFSYKKIEYFQPQIKNLIFSLFFFDHPNHFIRL